MSTPETISAFDVLARRDLPEYRARATLVMHPATGCEVLHLATSDTENLFAFCFATPPCDDTGVSHITEHSVLSGSRRYQLKEPFSVLMKGSLHTFLNALTYPDRTVYPAASCNRADFFNLLDVYADAVFHPLLRKETFMQEGWRLEPVEESGGNSFQYAGIVYNEMKGAYSSPDSIVGEWGVRSLFPDTPYRHDSGGDPRFLPSLTLEAARQFHARFYHPSNCRIFLYGDIPAEEILSFLHKRFLSQFSASKIEASIPLQPRWTTPRRLEKSFPVKPGTALEGRSSITLSWLLPGASDPLSLVANEVLSEVLIGSAGSPLRKALIDSRLGEDLSPASGLETDLKELVFTVGVRGTEPDREEKVIAVTMEALAALAEQGLDHDIVQSVINRVEFRHREIRGNGSPYALRLMGRALRGWVHGRDPVSALEFAPAMEALKIRLKKEPRFLESMIREGLVSNQHRMALVVTPDRDQEQRETAEEEARVKAVVGALSPAQKEKILQESRDFRSYQLAPDSPQALAQVPSLKRSDLSREVERIPAEERITPSGIPLSLHGLFTNEIVYIDLCFPTEHITGERSLFLPVFGRAVCGCGLPGRKYDKVALDLFGLTGGFSASLDAGGVIGESDAFSEYAFFRMRSLRTNLPDAAALISSMLSTADFTDLDRLRELILEQRNGMKASLVPGGHQYAMLRAASELSPAAAREEQWRGVTQLLFLEQLVKNLDQELPRIAGTLESIRRDLLVRKNLIANATADAESFADIMKAVEILVSHLPALSGAGAQGKPETSNHHAHARAEALLSSASVGYVARAIPGFRYDHPRNGPATVLGHLLSTGYLWEKVRMEGGAYGAFSYQRNMEGLFLFGSYRDPNIARTLHAFRDGLDQMSGSALDDSEVEKAIIGAVGREDRPLDPGEKGFVSLQRRLHGLTDDRRQARRDRLIATRPEELQRAARELAEMFDKGFTSVIGNKASLAEATTTVPELADRAIDLPE